MTEREENKARVAKFLDLFSAGDIGGLLDSWHDDGTWWVSGRLSGFSGTYGKQEMGALLASVKDLYKTGTLRITPLAMTAEGDRVAVEAEGYAELNDGRIYNGGYHFLFELAGEKVMHIREYMDTAHASEIFLTPQEAVTN